MNGLICVLILCMSLFGVSLPSDAPHNPDVSLVASQSFGDEIVNESISVLGTSKRRLAALQEIDSKTVSEPVQEITRLLEYMVSMDVSNPSKAIVLTFDTLIPSPGYYNIYHPENLSDEARSMLTEMGYRSACNMVQYGVYPSFENYTDIITANAYYVAQIDTENRLALTSKYTVVYLFYPIDDGQYDVAAVSFEKTENCIISTTRYLGKGNDKSNQYALDSNKLLETLVFSIGGMSEDSNPVIYDVSN